MSDRPDNPPMTALTMRDWFAGLALSGWMATYPDDYPPSEVTAVESAADLCYRLADAMLARREQS